MLTTGLKIKGTRTKKARVSVNDWELLCLEKAMERLIQSGDVEDASGKALLRKLQNTVTK